LDNDAVPNESGDGLNVPCNYLTYMDEAAYADWAGLRIMTELEYEKACRGPNSPLNGEYAWGTTNIHSGSNYNFLNAGFPDEYIPSLPQNTGNAMYTSTMTGIYPLRCGILAASSVNHTRQETGAGYYGVMELSGNLSERVVHIGTVSGRSYTGLHGDGELDGTGFANVSFWPGINGNTNESGANAAYGGTTGCTAAAGSGLRGGAHASSSSSLRTSDREVAGYTNAYANHDLNKGGRYVRTAP
jgi:hypothetical protein